MPTVRPTLKRKKDYAISKHEFYTAYHYALQYEDWNAMIEAEASLSSGNNDGMPHGTGTSDSTFAKAMKISEYRDKMRLIENTVREVAPDIYTWLLRGVTREDCTFNYLKMIMDIPCGKNYYYERRRLFYYKLSEKI